MSEATAKFHIAPDKDSLTRVSTSLSTLATARQQRLDSQSQLLTSLTRRLNNLKGQYTYEEDRHDPTRHAEEILALDTEKFKIAKGVNEAECESERLSGELEALKLQLGILEREGVEGGARGKSAEEREDETVLKLCFYRSLGIDAVQDEGSGEYKRAVVRNGRRGDVNVVNVDGGMESRFYANMVWDSL